MPHQLVLSPAFVQFHLDTLLNGENSMKLLSRIHLIGFICIIGLLAGCAGDPDLKTSKHKGPSKKELIREARKEGGVTIIHPIFSDQTARRLAFAFNKRYSLGNAFEFRSIRKGTGATVAQVRREIRSREFTVDIHLVHAPSFFAAASRFGAFIPITSTHWKDFTELVNRAKQYSNYPYVVTPFAYTFQPVWNSSCPGMKNINVTSYADTVQPALKGKTIAPDITKSFTYTNTAIGLLEGGFDMNAYWKKLKATDPLVRFRTQQKLEMVISCERPFDMWNISNRFYSNILKKPSLAKALRIGHFKEGQVILGLQMAVLKGGPHPHAGRLFVDFLLSKEGTDIVVEGDVFYSLRSGYLPPAKVRPYLLNLNDHKLLGMNDWIAAQKKFKAVRSDWRSFF